MAIVAAPVVTAPAAPVGARPLVDAPRSAIAPPAPAVPEVRVVLEAPAVRAPAAPVRVALEALVDPD